jgi:uncharacterized protein YjdB
MKGNMKFIGLLLTVVIIADGIFGACENPMYPDPANKGSAGNNSGTGGDSDVDEDDNGEIHVTGISLPKTLVLTVGDTGVLTATITPANASNKNIVWWQSSLPNVVSVDGNGHLVTKRWGTATIRIKTEDGGKTADCTVTVEPGLYIGNSATPVEDASFTYQAIII